VCDIPASQESYGPPWLLAGVQLPAALATAGPEEYMVLGTKIEAAQLRQINGKKANTAQRSIVEMAARDRAGARVPSLRQLLSQ
jgi:hypothetical protein